MAAARTRPHSLGPSRSLRGIRNTHAAAMRRLFGRVKEKLQADKFSFTIGLVSLSPWPEPASNREIIIGWQRGRRKRGATRSYGSVAQQYGRIGHIVRFDEEINLSASLYRVRAWQRGGQAWVGARDRGAPQLAPTPCPCAAPHAAARPANAAVHSCTLAAGHAAQHTPCMHHCACMRARGRTDRRAPRSGSLPRRARRPSTARPSKSTSASAW